MKKLIKVLTFMSVLTAVSAPAFACGESADNQEKNLPSNEAGSNPDQKQVKTQSGSANTAPVRR